MHLAPSEVGCNDAAPTGSIFCRRQFAQEISVLGHSVCSWQLICGKGGAAHLCRSPRGIAVERLVASGCLKARESRCELPDTCQGSVNIAIGY